MTGYVLLEWNSNAAEVRARDVYRTAQEAEEAAVNYSYQNKAFGGGFTYEVHRINYDTMTWATPEDL